jgi:HSP20 family protein
MDRMWDGGITRPWRLLSPDLEALVVPVEVTESDDEVEVKAELPGVKPEDVNITVSNGFLASKPNTAKNKNRRKRTTSARDSLRWPAPHTEPAGGGRC